MHMGGVMHTKNPFYGVWWARVDKWQGQSARWRGMESSRNFTCDTCLSEFDQGWVRDHQSPSGSKNYQREDTNQITSLLISLIDIYIWIPHPRDPEAGILHIVRNCCWFLETNIRLLGDLSFVWGEEGLPCWEDDVELEQLVVTPLTLSCLSIKAIQVFLHTLVSFMFYAFVWSIYIWS